MDNDAQWFLSPISAPGGGGEGMFNGGFGSNMYFDYRKYGLLVGQKWFAKSQANPVQKLQVVEIVMNS